MRAASRIARRIAARFVPALQPTVTCGGCGRTKDEAMHMISGPHVYLCDGCVEQGARQLAPRRPAPDGVRCRFCRQLRAKPDVTTVGDVVLCADCLGLMEAILEEAQTTDRQDTSTDSSR
jgi:hypothetical protein